MVMENKKYRIESCITFNLRNSILKDDNTEMDIDMRHKLYKESERTSVINGWSGMRMGVIERISIYMNKYIQRKQV